MNELLSAQDLLKRYKQALKDILDPIAAMRRNLPEGYQLDGPAAIRAVDNPQTYKDIASEALRVV